MLFRIFDPKTKQYSKGSLPGPTGRLAFSKYGKVWASRGALSNHIALFVDPLKYYKECVIVVIDDENETFTKIPFDVWYASYTQDKAKKGK